MGANYCLKEKEPLGEKVSFYLEKVSDFSIDSIFDFSKAGLMLCTPALEHSIQPEMLSLEKLKNAWASIVLVKRVPLWQGKNGKHSLAKNT